MKYRIKQEDKVNDTTVYIIERQLESGYWVYVEKTLTGSLAVAQKLFANIKAGIVNKETILEEFDSEAL